MSYIGSQPISGAFQKLDSFANEFDGIKTTFALKVNGVSVVGGTSTNMIIILSGVQQEPETAFTVSGSNIIFGIAPTISDTFFGIRLGHVGTITTVTDSSVGLSKVDANVLSAEHHSITPSGSIVATNVQSAIYELDGDITDLTILVGTKQPKMPTALVSTTVHTATNYGHYILINSGSTTIQLPANPEEGALVWVTVANSLTTNIIARNGKTIMELSENMTLDYGVNLTYHFKFVNNTWRLV